MYSGQVRPLVPYDRRIRYLDYFENQQRVKGAGFIKLERQGELCNISLQVSGLYRKDHFSRPVLLVCLDEEKELCKLQFADGGIKIYLEGLNSQNIGGQGISYEQLEGIRIPISEGKEIRCIWKHREAGKETEETNETSSEAMTEVSVIRESESKAPETKIKMDESMKLRGMQQQVGEQNTDKEVHQNKQEYNRIYKDEKWDQLWAIYPHIRPFSDEREYLSLGPSDFVLLQRQFYKLVNNSFLLHGYYSYKHLILMRLGKRNGVRYYIGVPGNLFEREKKTAVMYGFEGFEGADEPAMEGEFGYYLTPVEI